MSTVFIGRIRGIPILVDPSLIVLVLLVGMPYFTAGTISEFVQGGWIAAGLVGSILVHELAHAGAGRIVRCEATSIELNGCGGLCFFAKPRLDPIDDMFVTLAGPAANLTLWAAFHGMYVGLSWLLFDCCYDASSHDPTRMPLFDDILSIMHVLSVVAGLNISLFALNLLPSFPLDGGSALAAYLGRNGDTGFAMRTVAVLGFGVCALCVWIALRGDTYALVIAYALFTANRQVLAVYGRIPWKRWD